mmetsp:Transcript_8770/g.7757  ORF Transcript_8770/g.7757 Transcript_8770/m.7757 type:complete len:100 (-) Transcript_8770:36-335(-)
MKPKFSKEDVDKCRENYENLKVEREEKIDKYKGIFEDKDRKIAQIHKIIGKYNKKTKLKENEGRAIQLKINKFERMMRSDNGSSGKKNKLKKSLERKGH